MKVVCDTAMSKEAENKEAATTEKATLKGHLGQKLASKSQFPSWFKREDRKFSQANGTSADVVVAVDMTGNLTSMMDAVFVAPDYSMSICIIYVKKGLYEEDVEIKKRWNLVMVGDGMDGIVIIWKCRKGRLFQGYTKLSLG